MITTWKGKPITDISREQLLEVVAHAVREIKELRGAMASEREMQKIIREARR